MDAVFLSKSNVYEGDYECVLRNPKNEMASQLHYHDFYEFVIYLGSAGIFRIGDCEYLIKRGDVVLIDMFQPHTLIANKNCFYERFSISVDPGLLISFGTRYSNLLDIFHSGDQPHPVYHFEGQQFEKYLSVMEAYRALRPENGRDLLEKAMVHQLLAYAYNDCFTKSIHNETDSYHMCIIAQIIKYINANLGNELTLKALAMNVNYSEYYICRLFKKQTSRTLINYIQEKRIEQAARLMREGMPINEAAESVGFNNYSHFYKTFKKFSSCSPAEYTSALKKA